MSTEHNNFEDSHEIALQDDQNPDLPTDAGAIYLAMSNKYKKVFERAALDAVMDTYRTRLLASLTPNGVYNAETQAHNMIALAFIEKAEEAGLECRSIDRLDKIARRYLRRIHTQSLHRLQELSKGKPDNEKYRYSNYQLEAQIWEDQTMLHLLDEPVMPN